MPRIKGILIIVVLMVAAISLALIYPRIFKRQAPLSSSDAVQGLDLVGDQESVEINSEPPKSDVDSDFVESTIELNFDEKSFDFLTGNLLSDKELEPDIVRFAAGYNSKLSYQETNEHIASLLSENEMAFEKADFETSISYSIKFEGSTEEHPLGIIIGIRDAAETEPIYVSVFYENKK